jgi:hypothetical protein
MQHPEIEEQGYVLSPAWAQSIDTFIQSIPQILGWGNNPPIIERTFTNIQGGKTRQSTLRLQWMKRTNIAKLIMEDCFEPFFGFSHQEAKQIGGGANLLQQDLGAIFVGSHYQLQKSIAKKLRRQLKLIMTDNFTLEEYPGTDKAWEEEALDQLASHHTCNLTGTKICTTGSLRKFLQSETFYALVQESKKIHAALLPSPVVGVAVQVADAETVGIASNAELASVSASVTAAVDQIAAVHNQLNTVVQQISNVAESISAQVPPPIQLPPPPPIQLPPPPPVEAPPPIQIPSPPPIEPPPVPPPIQSPLIPPPVPSPMEISESLVDPSVSTTNVAQLAPPPNNQHLLFKGIEDPTAQSLRGTWLGDMYTKYCKFVDWVNEEKKHGKWTGDRAYLDKDEFDEHGLKYVSTFGKKSKDPKRNNRTDNYICIKKDSRLFKLCRRLQYKTVKKALRSTNTVGKFVCEGGIVEMAIRSGDIQDIRNWDGN